MKWLRLVVRKTCIVIGVILIETGLMLTRSGIWLLPEGEA